MKKYTGHLGTVRSVGFSEDGGSLASAIWDKKIRIWDVNTGKILNEFYCEED